jgi:hypothetical protein
MDIPFEQAVDWLCAKTVTYLPAIARQYEIRLWCHPEDAQSFVIGDVKGAIEGGMQEKKQQREYDKLYTKIEDLRIANQDKGAISFVGVTNSGRHLDGSGFQISIKYDGKGEVECHLHSCGMLLEEATP